jgi:hypothetical protein
VQTLTHGNPQVTAAGLERQREYFRSIQVWPAQRRLDPERWLQNFKPAELPHAYQLLSGLLYYSEDFVRRLFVSNFHALSPLFAVGQPLARRTGLAWRKVLSEATFSLVTGERPGITDSGFLFARHARDLLGVQEHRILDPPQALHCLGSGRTKLLILVDDFMGTGLQLLENWTRIIPTPSGPRSLARLAEEEDTSAIAYIPLFSTQAALDLVAREAPDLTVRSAHILTSQDSAIAPDSRIWPEDLRATALEFLEAASRRAGIPDLDGQEGDWRGFHRLALTLAFEHGVPDATLPIFKWNRNGWHPLIKSAT